VTVAHVTNYQKDKQIFNLKKIPYNKKLLRNPKVIHAHLFVVYKHGLMDGWDEWDECG